MIRVRLAPVCWALVLSSVLLAAAAAAQTRYDPRFHFRTLSTPRFDIHFHREAEAVARRLSRFIEAAAEGVDGSIGPPFGRVQVILVDQHDLSNGWATPLPYNIIEINAAAPAADSSIGNTDDWLRLVFIHEYAHIAHLSRAGGWIGGLRRGFGRHPVLFPNLYQPIWGIEGLATWQESASTGQGRVPAGDFRLLITRAAAAGRFEPIDRANGGNVDWPSGATPYLYGAYFHEFLADRHGAASLGRLADDTARRPPYLGSRAYRKVYGRPLGVLWREFAAATEKDREDEDQRAVRLTHHGFNVSGPRFAPDGRIFYSASTPHHFPTLFELRAPGGTPREVARRYLGNRIGIAGDRLVLDEIDLVRNVGLQSDLYLVDPTDGHRRRLTREARARDPDVSRGGLVACAVQMSDRRALAVFPLPAGEGESTPEMLISEPSTDFASPRWSPDARWIAAERRRLGGPSEIVLIDPAARSVRAIAGLPGGRSAAPAWMPDGSHVVFSAAVGREPFRIYRVDVASGALTVLEGTGRSAGSPDVSPDGHALVFVGYTPDGYDLFSMPLAGARWRAVGASVPDAGEPGVAARSSPALEVASRSYSPARTLVPRFWTPTIESDAGELVVGAATASVDALGRHAYVVEAGWAKRPRPDWQVAYAYDRWRPTFFAAMSDDTDPWRGGEIRARQANVGALLRASRVRVTRATLVAFHTAVEDLRCEPCAPRVEGRERRAAVRLGWQLSTARAFGYSVSAEEGGRFSATVEVPRTALGSDGNGVALTADARRYWRVWPRHGVLALRGAAAGSWGDPGAERVFSASGHGPRTGGFVFGRDAIGLLRGFRDDEVAGTRAVTANLDYRTPLRRIDRGLGTIPLFIRSFHGALFVDAGHAWTGAARRTELRWSFGAELSADSVVGFALPVTITAGAAWRHNGDPGTREVVAFGRIGRAF